jgi:hypothetical protein
MSYSERSVSWLIAALEALQREARLRVIEATVDGARRVRDRTRRADAGSLSIAGLH